MTHQHATGRSELPQPEYVLQALHFMPELTEHVTAYHQVKVLVGRLVSQQLRQAVHHARIAMQPGLVQLRARSRLFVAEIRWLQTQALATRWDDEGRARQEPAKAPLRVRPTTLARTVRWTSYRALAACSYVTLSPGCLLRLWARFEGVDSLRGLYNSATLHPQPTGYAGASTWCVGVHMASQTALDIFPTR